MLFQKILLMNISPMHSWHFSKYKFLSPIENQILGGTSINVNSISVLFFKKQHVFIWQYHTITNICVRTNIAVVLLPIWRLISNFDLKCLRQLNELHHIHVIHKIWKTNRNCNQLQKNLDYFHDFKKFKIIRLS